MRRRTTSSEEEDITNTGCGETGVKGVWVQAYIKKKTVKNEHFFEISTLCYGAQQDPGILMYTRGRACIEPWGVPFTDVFLRGLV